MKTTERFLLIVISILVIGLPTWAADLTFNVETATKDTYSQLLNNVRGKVKNAKLKYGGTNVPVMAAPTNPPKYLLIDLKAGVVSITIALDKNDLYVVGYLDKSEDGKPRAHFFADSPAIAKTTLFPEAKGAKYRLQMNYKGTYGELEKNAKADRSKVGLGKQPLKKSMDQVYGKKLDVPTEAKFMLVAIQMFAEATRFKYIENKIIGQKFDQVYNPDHKSIKFELSWQKITKGIKSSKNGVISPPIDLVDAQNKPWKVSKVSDVINDMGLLKNEGNSLVHLFSDVFLRFLASNNGDDLQL
ncbi:protein synthesis inhibitor PD-S2 [Beta vulgaris subsp. vulgaris]|uniref:protein synthesis inhibitor PD-S2 n=1 Tax=Beta vulgaris subsp. vulgaris TaxID=3555 RepID=UPI002036F0D8|nr:protein synthesis inhibitor PD-S2 [Beta vulgaris subsp. vulgaris]XP_057248007.1 protein synthesis inhibitor PD-S2 [Beta vulgaris subsp. vulgaris]